MQPPLTMYKHCHSTFTIKPISINSDATSIDYVQALPQHFHNQANQYQLRCNFNPLYTSTATALSQSIWSVTTPMQPRFTTYKQWHSTFTIDSITINSDTTLIHYIQAVAQNFYNRFDQSQVWSILGLLCRSTGKGVSPSIWSVTTLQQPWWTTYKHWHSTFTINLTSINSDAMSINYVQALPQHFHNQSNQYQVRCKLDSLLTSSGTALPQ